MALVLGFLWLVLQAAGDGGGVQLGEEGVEDPARRVQAGFVQESRGLAGVVGRPWQQAPSWPSPVPYLDGPTSPSFQLLWSLCTCRFLYWKLLDSCMACALTSSRSHPQKGPSPSWPPSSQTGLPQPLSGAMAHTHVQALQSQSSRHHLPWTCLVYCLLASVLSTCPRGRELLGQWLSLHGTPLCGWVPRWAPEPRSLAWAQWGYHRYSGDRGGPGRGGTGPSMECLVC